MARDGEGLPAVGDHTVEALRKVAGAVTDAAKIGKKSAGVGGDLVGPLIRAESERLQKVLADPNKMHHIFGKAGHGFDPLVSRFGSRESVVEQIYRGLQGEVSSTGPFRVERIMGGARVQITGRVVVGIPRISTGWVVP